MTTIGNDITTNYNTSATTTVVENQSEQKEAASLFEKMDNWTNAHANNMKQTTENIENIKECTQNLEQALALLDSIKDEDKRAEFEEKINELLAAKDECMVSIEEQYEQNAEELGSNFDFMEGKDAKNEEDYNAQLSLLAEGEFNSHKVKNNSEEITKDDFIKTELFGQEFKTVEEQKEAVAYSFALFDIIDQQMGNSDKNGTLSKKELESFYKNLDQYQGLDENGKMVLAEADGVIDLEGASSFATDAVNSMVANFDEIKNSKQIEDYVETIFS